MYTTRGAAFQIDEESAVILTAERDVVQIIRWQNRNSEALDGLDQIREICEESVLRGDHCLASSLATGSFSSAPIATRRRAGAIETRRRRGR